MTSSKLPQASAETVDSNGIIPGFERVRLPGDGIEVDALIGGEGPPLLLLHGYPQTRMLWLKVAPALKEHFSLIIPDLRGYGRSDKPASSQGHASYSKRQMARDQISTMAALGHKSFFVAGHDRGARVAYRLALDTPDAIRKLCVMDVIPTADVYNAGSTGGFSMYHWFFLAQPAPLPETLIANSGNFFLLRMIEQWSGAGFEFPPESLTDYLDAFRNPETLHASCEDYRAGWHVDRVLDEEDRGRRRIEAPTLLLWGREGSVNKTDPLEIWKQWTTDLRGWPLPGGHFVPEEAPEETIEALMSFFLA